MLNNGDDSGLLIDDEDIYVGYRRPEVRFDKKLIEDDELSDYVIERLRIARERAMEAYRATYTSHVNVAFFLV